MTQRKSRTSVSAGRTMLMTGSALALLTIVATPVRAQSSPPPSAPPADVTVGADTPPASQDASAGTAQDIVVTGSRIVRNGYSAPTPVTVATSEKLFQQTPSNIADGLNKLPILFGSNSQSTMLGANNTRSGNYLNLRQFGVNRSLILLDGHRVPATSFDGTVDANSLPQILVQRVDIVTAGASAVYGSDAITGVVNFITDSKYNGIKGVVQSGISARGDDASQRFGIAAGFKLGDRGHLLLSGERYHSAGIPRKEDRPLSALAYTETGAGTAANPYVLVANARVSNITYGGLITTGPLANQMFLPNGTLAPFNPGTATGTKGISSGGDGAYWRYTALQAKLDTYQTYGKLDYDLTDDINVYIRGTFAQSTTAWNNTADPRTPGSAKQITIFSGNPYLPTAAQTVLTNTNTASFQLGRQFVNDFGDFTIKNKGQTYSAAAGADGTIFGRFKWDAFYEHGQSTLNITQFNNVNNPRLYASADAVRDPSGNIVCRVTLTSPGLYPGCVPVNLFGEGVPSAQAIGYIEQNTYTRTVNKLDDVAVNLTGDLVNLWAGPLSVAVGGEFRKFSFATVSTPDLTTTPNFAGLRGGFTSATSLYSLPGAGAGSGANQVWEINGEAVLPVLKDLPFARLLEVNGAVRYTSYRTSGTAVTWKAGVNWEPTSDIRVRLVASRDIRAPTLSELFAGTAFQVLNYTDTHTNTGSSVLLVSSGNPGLVPEKAQTYTGGVVYRPSWLRGFSMSVDYFQIRINNAISTVGGNSAQSAADCEQSNGTSPLCQLFIRPLPFSDRTSANYPTRLISENLNVGTAITKGVDFEADYLLRPGFVPGQFGLRLLGTYQPVLKQRQTPLSPLFNFAGAANTGLTKWRISLQADYTVGPVTFDFTPRWRSKMRQNSNTALVFLDPDIPSQWTADASVTIKPPHIPLEMFVAVNNLFDTQPDPYGNLSNSAAPNAGQSQPIGEDVVLRYFTAGVRFRF